MKAIAITGPNFVHRLDGRLSGGHAAIDIELDGLDGTMASSTTMPIATEAEHGGHINVEAQQRKQRERSQDRDRHGQQRDQRSAPALQEQGNHNYQ